MTPARRTAHFPVRTVRPGRVRAAFAGVSALLLAGGMMGGLTSADAATPTAGTVTPTTAAGWGGGPFLVSNPVGAATTGTPDCTAPDSCDDFKLTVDTPAGYEADHHLKIQVDWPNTAADFDVYLLDSTGAVVASAATSDDPEVLEAPVPAGDYTVEVVPFLVTGDSYTASASLVDAPVGGAGNPGPPSTETAPGYVNYAAPASLAAANDAGEPSIGNSFVTGATMYQAYRSTFKVDFDVTTSPAKASWADVTADASKGCVGGNTESLDPILFTDSATGRTFESQLTLANSLTCYTDDDGETWSASTGGGIPSGVDHQTIGGGPYAADAVGPLPTSDYAHSVYYCSQDIATAFCAASNDGGATFGAGVPTYDLSQCGGLHGHVKVAPDGTAYLPNKGCSDADGVDRAAVAISTDGGASWVVKTVPGSSAGASDPSVSFGQDGTVYLGYVGEDGLPAVATSTDKGDTWANGQTVGSDLGVKNGVFPTMVAGDGDRAALAYLGSTTGGDSSATNVFPGIWHLYIDTTYDGGKTWVTSDATPTDPVQRGSICTNGTTCGDDRNLLDFMDVTMDDHGRVLVGYADGCIDACVTDPTQNNRDAYATIARQSTGKTLLSAFDPALTSRSRGKGKLH